MWSVALVVGCAQDPVAALPEPIETGTPVVPLVAAYERGRVVVRAPWEGAGPVSVTLRSWGASGSLHEVAAVDPHQRGERTEYAHAGLVEWWERGLAGLEQGFTVAEPPAGELVLDLLLEGAVAEVDADALGATWATEGGGELRYEGLASWDASGSALPSRMEATADGLRLVVDTIAAVGAVTVDPLLPGAAWMGESNQAFATFGASVASAGDVNGDGFDDVVVGASNHRNGQFEEGAAFLYLGSAAGLQATPAWTAEGNQVASHFGSSVASAGDVNGDGYGDVVVGAPAYDDGQLEEGAAFVYLGSAMGLGATPSWTAAEANQAEASFGWSVASAGDVNGDGYDDVVVGARNYDNGQINEGMAVLYLGSAVGLSARPAWVVEGDQSLWLCSEDGYTCHWGGAHVGSSVASAGDVNGDGYDDVVVGARGYDNGQVRGGAAFLYLGSAVGPQAAPSWTGDSNQADSYFGHSVASAGDVNGDGYSDVVVGSTYYDDGQLDEGAAFLYLGSAVGLQAAPSWSAEADQEGAYFGRSVASAGDVNGDGYDDLVVGAHFYQARLSQDDAGAAFLYLGSAAGLQAVPAGTAGPNQAQAIFGSSVASAGDVDGDGFADVVVGAQSYDDGQSSEGAAFLYLGRPY